MCFVRQFAEHRVVADHAVLALLRDEGGVSGVEQFGDVDSHAGERTF